MFSGRRLQSLAALLALVAAAAQWTGSAAARKRILPGTYRAQTSQGDRFRFRIEAHTPFNSCGTRRGQYCFIELSYPEYNWTCANGQVASAGQFPVPNGFIRRSGRFAYSQRLEGFSQPLVSFTVQTAGRRVSGTMREEDLYEPYPGVVDTCDSGTIKWSAHRI